MSDFEIENGVLKKYHGAGGNVIIPAEVTSIGDNAFCWCRSLTGITIPNSVTSIGDLAFYDCNSLISITIPDSITSIGDSAFRGCTGLTSIAISDSVTSIGHGAFQECSSLTSVNIPDSVTNIGDCAFQECSSLTSITIPDSVTSIGVRMFSKCSSLTSIIIPDSVTSIGVGMFSKCSSLTSIIIPDSVVSIGDMAFSYCRSLTGITIPDSVISIGNSAFNGCDGLANKDGLVIVRNVIHHCMATVKNIAIPDSVICIGDGAFSNCNSLTNITIPDSVTYIGSSAFSDCNSLTGITIPDSVIALGNRVFHECSSLISITIPDSVTSIGDYMFWNCSSLTNVNIPDSVTSIGRSAFFECKSLTSISFPNPVTKIGNSAFYDCRSLISIAIPDGVASIEEDTFKRCRGLNSIVIPSGVTSIGRGAFQGCSSLTSIAIPSGVTSLEKSAFEDCSSLQTIAIPASMQSIGEKAFRQCKKLASIDIPSGVKIASKAFENCTALNKIQTGTRLSKAMFGNSLLSSPVYINDPSMLPNDMKLLAIAGFGKNPDRFNTERYKAHCKYIKANIANLVSLSMKYPALLSVICENKWLSQELFDVYQEASKTIDSIEIKAILLNYQQNNLTSTQNKKSLDDILNLNQRSVSPLMQRAMVKKLNPQGKVELLEEITLHGTMEDLELFFEKYHDVQFTARALGYAVRYRDTELVEAMIKHGCVFSYTYSSAFVKKYNCKIKISNRYEYQVNYALMTLNDKSLDAMSAFDYPKDLKVNSVEMCCKNISTVCHMDSQKRYMQNLLYWSVLINRQEIVQTLIENGIDAFALGLQGESTAYGSSFVSMDASTMHERNTFIGCLLHNPSETAAILQNLVLLGHGKKVYFSGPELHTWEGDIKTAFCRKDVFDLAITEKIDISKAKPKELLRGFVKGGNISGLEYAIEQKWVSGKPTIMKLCEKESLNDSLIHDWLQE